jgi:preprotein translocase subunit SecD
VAPFTEPAPGRERIEYRGEVLYLAAAPLVSDVDFLDVQTFVRQDGLVLSVRCTQQGDERFEAATRQHVGRPLAVLAESEVRAAPVVQVGVRCTSAQIGLEMPREAAESLAARIQQRWPSGS